MILGTLAHWNAHKIQIPRAIADIVDAVLQADLDTLKPGRYEIADRPSYFMIQEMPTRLLENTRTEAHRDHADVQVLLAGAERYGVAPLDPALTPVDDRLEKSDIAFYPDPANETFIDLAPGMFAVFFPGEFHRPCCAIGESAPVRKLVIKIHLSELLAA